jgi:hypothetical protein
MLEALFNNNKRGEDRIMTAEAAIMPEFRKKGPIEVTKQREMIVRYKERACENS